MTKTVVASVSEPSKPEPFIESYAIQMRGETDVEGYYASRKSAERDLAEDYAPGAARLVIIPGETDDAPPATANGWRPASEPPDSERDVVVHPPSVGLGGCERAGFYCSGAWWRYTDGGQRQVDDITHWHELPEPPK